MSAPPAHTTMQAPIKASVKAAPQVEETTTHDSLGTHTHTVNPSPLSGALPPSAIFSRVSSPSWSGIIQPKLSVGPVDDPFEKEADAVADRVVNGSLRASADPIPPENEQGPEKIQRKCAACEEEESVQRKPIDITPFPKYIVQRETEEEESVQRKPIDITPLPTYIVQREAEENADLQANTLEDGLSIQRKCAACEEEESVQRKPIDITPLPKYIVQREAEEEESVQRKPIAITPLPRYIVQREAEAEEEGVIMQAKAMGGGLRIQAKENDGSMSASACISSRIAASRGSGFPLQGPALHQMQDGFGRNFGNVRIHADGNAADLSSDLNAKAFAVGNDVFFGAGQFQPQTREGQRLLAHELTHTVQQGAGLPSTIQKAGNGTIGVSLVEVSCPARTITFHTNDGTPSYTLSSCELIDGEFEAKVSIIKGGLNLAIDDARMKDKAATFSMQLGTDQKRPSSLFGTQKTVKIRLISGKTEITSINSLSDFKQKVKLAGKLRMMQNKKQLEAWREFLTKKLTPYQAQGQVMATQALELGTMAAKEGGMALWKFDAWTTTTNPHLRWVQEQQIKGRLRACSGCHFTLKADELGKREAAVLGPQLSPLQNLEEHANAELLDPAPRPQNLGKYASIPGQSRFLGMDGVARTFDAIRVIRPYLEELGPSRYGVLPSMYTTFYKSPSELMKAIDLAITARQADYDAFIKAIDDPSFDYLKLRPIVEDLMQLATPEVVEVIQKEIASAKKWAIVKGIVIGAATIGLLVLAIFPPTSALGVAGVVALESGLAAYGIQSGYEMYQEGLLYSQGKGADDVITKEQQESADSMMAMGLVNIGLSTFALGSAGFKAIKLLRTVTAGSKGAGAVNTIEAVLEDGRVVKIDGIAAGSPKIVVTDKSGTLLVEGSITEEQLASLVGRPTKLHELPSNGIYGATPRAGTPARPLSFQGKAPTCGPVACDMLAATGGVKLTPSQLEQMIAEFPKGSFPKDAVDMLRRAGVVSEAKAGMKVADLAAATKSGEPAMAIIKTDATGHALHWVIVDGVTVRNGVSVVAIRNPWGIQYFQSEKEFAKIFTGQGVVVNYWK